MAKFAVGDRVVILNTKVTGIIISVREGRGRVMYTVFESSENQSTQFESNLVKDMDVTDPFQCCEEGIFAPYSAFSEINTSFKIKNTNNNTISSLKASKTIFKPYQFKPLLKLLNSDSRRILIADEVGLGKTIEAGHIMMEMSARKELKNVLIICPKMLQEKWQTELKEKFNFSFQIFSSVSDLVTTLKNGNVKAIINYEKIRTRTKRNDDTDKDDEQNALLEYLLNNKATFDMVLCDEAHRLRNTNKTYKGAEIIVPLAHSTVFLTATPIMINETNLYNLLHLLDDKVFNQRDVFPIYLAMNKPFIWAISAVNSNRPLKEIASELKNMEILSPEGGIGTVDEIFRDYQLYQRIISNMQTMNGTTSDRVSLQFDLSSMSMMNNIFSRTRKRDVTTDFSQPDRCPHKIVVELRDEERREYEKVIEYYEADHTYYDEFGDAKMEQGHVLGLIQKKRRIASSIYGYLGDQDNQFGAYADMPDSKFEKLMEIVKEVVVGGHDKLIIFALFKSTLRYLAIRFSKLGLKTALIHGDVEDRVSVIENFRDDATINILLSSEVGSEGLDMQFCSAIVNYDLPWNPMVVEQRIGRIDRFGQKAEKIHIYNLIVDKSIQEDIYDRLLDRIGIFRGCIGDLEAILDAPMNDGSSASIGDEIQNLEKTLYCTELSQQERLAKCERIAKAIEMEKKHLEVISDGLTDALTNDAYFKDEITKIQKNHRYIEDLELLNYVKALIDGCLTECILEENENDKGVYSFRLPMSNRKCLYDFLSAYTPKNASDEMIYLFKTFQNKIREASSFKLTFNQEIAFDNKRIEFVNAYHPIITAAREYFSTNERQTNKTFQFSISKNHFADIKIIQTGCYFLAVYNVSCTKSLYGNVTENHIFIPVVYDVSNQKIINDSDISERILGEAQLYAKPTYFSDVVHFDGDFFDELRNEFTTVINTRTDEYVNDQLMRLESNKKQQLERMRIYYDNKIVKEKETLENIRFLSEFSYDEDERKKNLRVLPAREGALKNLIKKKEDELQSIESNSIELKNIELVSLSQISIS